MLDGPGDLILAVGCVASEPDGAGVVIFHYICLLGDSFHCECDASA